MRIPSTNTSQSPNEVGDADCLLHLASLGNGSAAAEAEADLPWS